MYHGEQLIIFSAKISPALSRKSTNEKCELIDEIKQIWKHDESYEKFSELKIIMESHGRKDELVKLVIFNRVCSLLICMASALFLFYLYVVDLKSADGRDLR